MQVATEIVSFTCICCPLGCQLEVAFDAEGGVSDVSGYTCARGADYARKEATQPERMVTMVLNAQGSLEPLSVKTSQPVPKDRVSDVLTKGSSLELRAPIAAGDILVENICDTRVDLVATKSIMRHSAIKD